MSLKENSYTMLFYSSTLNEFFEKLKKDDIVMYEDIITGIDNITNVATRSDCLEFLYNDRKNRFKNITKEDQMNLIEVCRQKVVVSVQSVLIKKLGKLEY